MLTVACVLRSGGEYGPWHVERLWDMVTAEEQDLRGFQFVCLTDIPGAVAHGYDRLIHDWPGFWSKIELFRPGLFVPGRVLYLDLDVTVVGPLDDLADYPQPFAAMKDPLYRGVNSSVMAWTPSADTDRLYTEFTPDVMKRLPGDQDWINEQMPKAARFPLGWCPSYKAHVRPRGRVSSGARVVVFHGKPRPWEVKA